MAPSTSAKTSRFSEVAYTERVAAWDLRAAWASQREVVVVMEGERGRVRGFVEHVAASNAYALIFDGRGSVHVPLAFAATVRRPHFHEPLDGDPVVRPERRVILPFVHPGQLTLFGVPEEGGVPTPNAMCACA